MNLKNINKYKFRIFDKKIIDIYNKYIDKKKISLIDKNFFKNSFLGLLTQLDWCLAEKKIDNKIIQLFQSIFLMSILPEADGDSNF